MASMNLLIKWLISALALLLASAIFPGITVSSVYIALVVALILGLLNALVRPVLLILTLPINLLTLGLFTFVINGLIFWFVASFVSGFSVDGLLWAIIGALFISIVSWTVGQLFEKSENTYGRAKTSRARGGSYYHVDKVEKPDEDREK